MDTFSTLEDKVRQAAALVRDLRAKNASLEQELPEVRKRNQRLESELPELRTRVQELHKALEAAEKGVGEVGEDARKLAAAERELKGMKQEREEVRVRIARLIEALDGLE